MCQFYRHHCIPAFFSLGLSALVVLAVGCGGAPPTRGDSYEVYGKRYYPLSSSAGFVQEGLASWYGRDFHGRFTSTGERYNMYARTAAHKTLPFNTYVRVINLKNGKKTLVRINDRGPFVRGRIIDLTYTAARDLDMVEAGVVPVRVEALGFARKQERAAGSVREYVRPASYGVGDFTIQVGAFAHRGNALRLHGDLNRKYANAFITIFDRGDQKFYRVRVGSYRRLEEAEAASRRLQREGFVNAFVVARDR